MSIEGQASADAEEIAWENLATGASGTTTPGADWSAAIPLEGGDNPILVTAKRGAEEASRLLFVVKDALADGFGAPRLFPSGVLVGEATPITLAVTVPLGATPTAVEAWEVEPDGTPLAKVADLFDDGDPAHADENALDGTFSGVFEETATEAGRVMIRPKLLHSSGHTWGLPAVLSAANPIDPAAFEAALAAQDAARQRYEEVFATDGREAAIAAILEQLSGNEHVTEVGRAGAQGGLWIVFEAGFLGGLLLSPEGTKGCGTDDECPVTTPFTTCYGPFDHIFGPYSPGGQDEAQTIYQMLTGDPCPAFEPTGYAGAGLTDVDTLKVGATYGAYVISAHGDSWYADARSYTDALIGANGPLGGLAALVGVEIDESIPIVAFGEHIDAQSLDKYLADLAHGRLVVCGILGTTTARLAFTPGWIYEYHCMPDAIAYVSACRSAFNSKLAHAFLARGAKAFVGYTDYVDAGWAAEKGIQLFTNLMHGKSVGEAFEPGTGPDGSAILRWGVAQLRLPDGHIENPSFEDGMDGWDGFASAVRRLGVIEPPSGEPGECNEFMCMIPILSSAAQVICVPEDATKLIFEYDVVTQALNEVCVPEPFETKLKIHFTPKSNTLLPETWLDAGESDFCGQVQEVDAGFGDSPLDTDGTWHTGWKTMEVNVGHFQGEEGNLEFVVLNPDPPLPAVLLIDRLRWEYEE